MIDSVFILSGLGEVLIEKHYRHGTSRATVADLFWSFSFPNQEEDNIRENSSDGEDEVADDDPNTTRELCPIVELNDGEHIAIHIKRGDLTFVTTLTKDVSPLMVIEFLNRLVDVLTDYLGPPDEVKIKDSFSTVYQILDEMLDGGLTLVTESNALKAMIAPPTVANKVRAVVMGGVNASSLSPTLPFGATSTSPWRADTTVTYLQNEIFLDVEEFIDCVLEDQQPNNVNIRGVIRVNSRLSGMPELTLTFDHPDAVLADVSFHPCVRIERWERERVLSFLPPDGVFELMRYTPVQEVANNNSIVDLIPFYCKPTVSSKNEHGRVEVVIGPKKFSHFSSGMVLDDVRVKLPLPLTAKFIDFKVPEEGKVSMVERTCVWTLPKLDANKPGICRLTGSFTLDPPFHDSQSSLTALFEFSMQASRTISGLKVSQLEIVNQSYKYFKGVKTVLKSGEFQIRC